MKIPLTSTMDCDVPLTSDELLLLHVGISSFQDDRPSSPTHGIDVADRDEWAMRTSDVEDEHGKPKLLGSIQLEKAARSLIALTNGTVDNNHQSQSELSIKLTGVRRKNREHAHDSMRRSYAESLTTTSMGEVMGSRPPSAHVTADKDKRIRVRNASLSPQYLDTQSNYMGSAVLNGSNNKFFSSDMLASPSGSSTSTSVGVSFSSNLKRPHSPLDPVSYTLKNGESSKRRRAVTSQPISETYLMSNSTPEPRPGHFNGTLVHKPALLTISQKKANHIQSEQKRRANIRRGYESLCSTVPALREAIRLEDEAQHAAELAANNNFTNGKKKRRRPKEEAERNNDGRAGPKSENVVLQKTIDYITDLLSGRSELLDRLHRARALLPNGHPALTPRSEGPQLWEHEWTGGTGIQDGEEEGYSDEDER